MDEAVRHPHEIRRAGKRRGVGCGYRFHVPPYILEDDPEFGVTPRALWYGFVKDTTAHGLPNLHMSRGKQMSP